MTQLSKSSNHFTALLLCTPCPEWSVTAGQPPFLYYIKQQISVWMSPLGLLSSLRPPPSPLPWLPPPPHSQSALA